MSHLDIIIPVKNEEKSISLLVKNVHKSLSEKNIEHSFIVIDDSSTDKTVNKVKSLSKKYPIQLFGKKGKPGKAYSILEGSKYATAPYIAVIDVNLEYSSEILSELLEQTQKSGVVVVRKRYEDKSIIKKYANNGSRFLFNKFLLGFDYEISSEIKIFKGDIIRHLQEKDLTARTFGIPLIDTALDLGYSISEIEVEPTKKKTHRSKVYSILRTKEFLIQGMKHRLKAKIPLTIEPDDGPSMSGAGFVHKKRRFVTHTTLQHHHSAIETFTLFKKNFWP